MKAENKTYMIIRFFRNDEESLKVIQKGLTLAEARRHCSDPATSYKNNAGEVYAFDGYEEE